jgi:hypothetical protein
MLLKTVFNAAILSAICTTAVAHDIPVINPNAIIVSEEYPSLEGHMDGGWFRPIGADGPSVPAMNDIFSFIQLHSPIHSRTHVNAGAVVFATDNIQPPVVRFLTTEQMEVFAGGGMGSPLAIYEEGYMYLNEDIDFASDEDFSILVHELVHHVQWFSGLNERRLYQSCPIKLEHDAYRIQLEWMHDADVSDDWVYQMKGTVICYPDRP